MPINAFLVLITIWVNMLPTQLSGQAKAGREDIDFPNIFNTQYTCISIPVGDSLFVYAPPSAKSPTNWSLTDRLAIPGGTIAMDGNIGKNIFMKKQSVIFEEDGRYDSLCFDWGIPPIDPRLWIRTPHSTGVDSYFLSGEKSVCYFRDYKEDQKQFVWRIADQLNPHMFKENRTQPVLTEKAGFKKLYMFISRPGSEYLAGVFRNEVSFFRYPMVHDSLIADKIIAPLELNFSLPFQAISAFIYDFKYLAVVLQEGIYFYDFDSAKKNWRRTQKIPTLYFERLNQDKKHE